MKKLVIGIFLIIIVIFAYRVFVTQSNKANELALERQEKSDFNIQFLTYEGTQVGTMVKTLISVVDSSNDKYSEEKEVVVKYLKKEYKTSKELKTLDGLIRESATYEISFEYDSNNLIYCVQISDI